jgi:zinc protease
MIVPLIARAEQLTPPLPAAPRAVNVPQPAEKTLANGLRVIVIQKIGLPLVAARLMVKTGGEADPPDRAGLADMTASLLTKGTTTKSAEEIARDVEALGATIESGAAWDNSFVALSALASNYPEAMKYVADVVLHPTFKTEEIDRLREQNIDELQVALTQPRSLAGYVAARVIYGGGAYGHNLGGTPKSMQAMTRPDIARFHEAYYRPDNAVFVVAGDVAPETMFALAEKLLGTWKSSGTMPSAPQDVAAPAAQQPRVVVVDLPDAGQAAVVVTLRGLRRIDPEYNAALVANAVLGGGYSSRLNQEIRIKRGLSYGAGSAFEFRRMAGPFTASAQTKNESAAEVATIMLDELAKMTSAAVASTELTPRKAVLIGNFGRALETTSGLVGRIAQLALYGLSLTEINNYIRNVEAVTPADVQTFAASHMKATRAAVVIVGDAKKLLDAVKQKFQDVEVIPIAQLDLDLATMRKAARP